MVPNKSLENQNVTVSLVARKPPEPATFCVMPLVPPPFRAMKSTTRQPPVLSLFGVKKTYFPIKVAERAD